MPPWVGLAILLGIFVFVGGLGVAAFKFMRYAGTLPRGAEHLYGCADCGEPLAQLPGTQTEAFPGFICTRCGLKMRPPRSTAFYIAIMVLAAILSAAFIAPIVLGAPEAGIVYPFMLVLIVYALIKLQQPKAKRVEPSAESGNYVAH